MLRIDMRHRLCLSACLALSSVALIATSLAPSDAIAAPKGKSKSKAKDEAAKSEGAEAGDEAEAKADAEVELDLDADPNVEASASDEAVEGGAAAGAEASGMKGRVGLMGTRTVSGLNGISVRYYVVDKLTIGLTTGAAIFTHKEPDDNGEFKQNNTVGLFGIGPSVFYWPYQGPRSATVHADFGVGVRTLVYLGFTGANEDDAEDTLNDPIEIDVEIPLSTQLWVGRRVSIAPEFGVAFRIIPGTREPDDNGDFDMNPGSGVGSRLGTTDGPGLGFELGNTAGLFMGLHVGYWFGKL